ncbi:hypothetical protein SAMN05421747_11730 [Parapedobacter composti]|uniref:Uncharacterized protein n=1 Tax=Parapedobacter composti TaxID=623281 RepID=A0A1I1KVH9_9SPHI|nr:hypothetical protein SAMN05421747_11730 [Parapedobacter composti]
MILMQCFQKSGAPFWRFYGVHDNRMSFPEEKERMDLLVAQNGIEIEAKCFARMNHFLQTSSSKNDTEVFELKETVSPPGINTVEAMADRATSALT